VPKFIGRTNRLNKKNKGEYYNRWSQGTISGRRTGKEGVLGDLHKHGKGQPPNKGNRKTAGRERGPEKTVLVRRKMGQKKKKKAEILEMKTERSRISAKRKGEMQEGDIFQTRLCGQEKIQRNLSTSTHVPVVTVRSFGDSVKKKGT